MSEKIIIQDELIKYILFQRTGYIKYAKNQIIKLLSKYSPFDIYKRAVKIEANLRKRHIVELFQKDMENEYKRIRPFLPESCNSILDIGCGVAGIDIWLFRHYQNNELIKFYLLDKSKIDKKVFYNYKQKGSFYNSLQAAKEFLSSNEIPENNIHLLEVNENYSIQAPSEIDLVISLISWGFHYPLSTYLDQVYDLLRDGGHLIIDLRKGNEDLDLLERKFSSVTKVFEQERSLRILAIK